MKKIIIGAVAIAAFQVASAQFVIGPSSNSPSVSSFKPFVVGPTPPATQPKEPGFYTNPVQGPTAVSGSSRPFVIGPTAPISLPPPVEVSAPSNPKEPGFYTNPVQGPTAVFGPSSPFVIGPTPPAGVSSVKPSMQVAVFGPSSPPSVGSNNPFVVGPTPPGTDIYVASGTKQNAINSSNSVFCSANANVNCGWALKATK